MLVVTEWVVVSPPQLFQSLSLNSLCTRVPVKYGLSWMVFRKVFPFTSDPNGREESRQQLRV
jgi:hypothetical protein